MNLSRGVRLAVVLAAAGALGAAEARGQNPLKTGPAVRGLAFSADGKCLAAVSAEPEETGHATVWEMPGGKLVFSHRELKGLPSVAFSPDSRHLVLGSFTDNALVIDTVKWTIARKLPGHGRAARGVAFAHDGKTLAVSSYDGFIRLWDVPAWSLRKTLEQAHKEWIYAVAFSKDGKTLASCGDDHTAKLWDLETGKNLHTFEHGGIVRRILFTPDDRHVVYTSWDGTLAIRERETGRPIADFDRYGAPDDVAVAPDGKSLAVISGDARLLPIGVEPLDAAAAQKIEALMARWEEDSLQARDRASDELVKLGLAAVPALRRAAKEAASAEARLRARLARAAIRSAEPKLKLRHPEGGVQSVAFSPDGQTLATGGPDGVVRLWSVADGHEVRMLRQFPATAPGTPRSEY